MKTRDRILGLSVALVIAACCAQTGTGQWQNPDNAGGDVIPVQFNRTGREAGVNLQIAGQQKQICTQKTVIVLLAGILFLVVIIAVVIGKSCIRRKKINILLSDQKDGLSSFNEALLAVNNELQKTYDELDGYKNDLEAMVNKKTAELQRAFLQVQESDRFKAAFFANMSHELRTPLNAIIGFLQLVFRPGVSAEQQEQMIAIIGVNAGLLLSLVDDIVDLSKIDSGLLVIHPEQFYIDDILDSAFEDAEQQIGNLENKRKLTLIFENRLDHPQEPVLIDGRRVRQVLGHLLNNAIKFTEAGYILFGCEETGNSSYLRFFVEDTGIGIPDEHKSEIFKRFWKSEDVYTQRYRGVGLGLSLCESLAGLMSGSFEVESVPGQGSLFSFTVKVAG